jgi:hypothetical protein
MPALLLPPELAIFFILAGGQQNQTAVLYMLLL